VTTKLQRFGREEAKEHGVSQKLGEKLAKDHLVRFGSSYYVEAEKMEKKLLARKNRKKKRT